MSTVATYAWAAKVLEYTLHGFLLSDYVTALWNGEQKTLDSNIVMLSM